MKNITRILTVILIICIVFSLIASIVSRPVDLYKIERDPSSLLSHIDGWTFSDGSKAEFNSKKDTSSISVYKSITENEVKFSAIGFNNYGQNVEAYIDGTLIYSLRAAKDLGASSDILCIINLPENLHPGQNLKISLSSSHTAEVPKIYGGSFFEFIALHILPRLPHFMLLLVNALVILIVSTAFIYKRIRVLLLKNNVHWFLLFLTMATLWVLTDTRIIQILRPDGFISGYILSFESFFLMTVPFMIFLKKVIKSFNTIGSIAVVSLFLNFIAMNILNFTGIYLFYESIWITHVILITIIILAVICIIYDYIKYRNAYSRALMISIGVFVSFSLIEIINYWRSGKVSDSATLFFQIGFLMFILTQLVFLMNYSSRLIFEGMKSEQYYNLAMTDAITGIPNRLAYSEKLKNLQKLESESEAIALYCDLNNLKETNDTLGHFAGDCLIIGFADCLVKTFGQLTDCYRIGGDEFAVIFLDSLLDVHSLTQSLTISIDEYNKKNSECFISVAIGAAERKIRPNNQTDVYDLILDAENTMYSNKAKYKRII